MNIDQIIQCDIVISESMTIEGGYDSTLIVGPLPANASDHTTPDVSVYSNTDELKDAGFTVDDPVYIAVQKYFSQSPRPKEVYVAVQKQPSGATEGVDVTLDRANATSGWYAVCPAGIAEDKLQKISDWVEANTKMCIAETTSLSASPISEGMSRTAVIHASTENDCANAAYLGRFLSYTPGSESWQYKSLNAIESQPLSNAETKALEAKNVSFYTKLAGKPVVVGGKMSNGEWIDTIRFCDWLKTQIQQELINLLLEYPKIPYTTEGATLVESAIRAALDKGVKAGGIANPEVKDDEVLPSYTITIPAMSELDSATRKTRKLTGIKWVARLAGAITAFGVGGTVNY